MSKNKEVSVDILCTERNIAQVDNIIKEKNASNINVQIIRPFWHFTLPHYLEIKLQHRYFLYKKYKKQLSDYDVIVCSLYNDLMLKQFISSRPKLIFAGHGIANRSYSYDDQIKQFDFILLAGNKEKEIRTSLNQLKDGCYSVTGYVKYEMCKDLITEKIFNNNNPTVFYNPHWLKEYSSFYNHGVSILDQFADNKDYNLICAPHSLLTTRNKSLISTIKKYSKYENIHIDLGSQNCHDMTYLKISDIYLGDISSQALEFLLHKKRPCIYIDVNQLNIDKYEFHSWELGEVVSNSDNIFETINKSNTLHQSKYTVLQMELLKKLFHNESISPSELAAQSIYNYLTSN